MEEDKNILQPSSGELTGEKEPGSFRLIFTLGLAGFLAGVVLVAAYIFTKPIIEANKAAAIEKAIFKVLPQCTSFQTLELVNGKLVGYDPKGKKQASKDEAPKLVYLGKDKSGALAGFAVPGSEIGFADIIGVLIGYDANKKAIIGFEVLECKETPGLGDKIIKDADFQKNFIELLTEPEIMFAKNGEKTHPNEVEAITGATISSRAVIRLMNKSMQEWKVPIGNYMKTTDLKITETNHEPGK